MSHPATTFQSLEPDQAGVLLVMIDRHLGNAVISLPVVQRLLEHFHDPPDLLVDERYAPLFARLPAAGRICAYPQQTSKRRGLRANLRPLALLARLAASRYRCVLDLTGLPRSALLTAATLAPLRVTIRGRHRRRLYSHALPEDVEPHGPHVLNRYASLLHCIGQTRLPPPVRLRAGDEAHAAIAELLHHHDADTQAPLVVIHPGAGKRWRQWPAERFARVADTLIERHAAQICIIGAPSEQALMQQVRSAMRHPQRALALSTSLENLLALYERAAVMLSNESGPTHLAATTDLPIVTLFGPAKEQRWRPLRDHDLVILRGAPCDPRCRSQRCAVDLRCLMRVEPDQMIEAATPWLQATPRLAPRQLISPR